MRLFELAYACRLYPVLADFDASLEEFQRRTRPAFDLWRVGHRKALFVWLNSWGCRQFAKKYHQTASRELVDWGRRHLRELPSQTDRLMEVSSTALDAAAAAYGDLKERRASLRWRGRKSWSVTFGPTGAAKILYALRPQIFSPWDDPIRDHLEYDGSADSYRAFLEAVQKEVRGLEEDALGVGVKREHIPAVVGRPASSLPKLIDEYYWVTITREFPLPSADEMQHWGRWAGVKP